MDEQMCSRLTTTVPHLHASNTMAMNNSRSSGQIKKDGSSSPAALTSIATDGENNNHSSLMHCEDGDGSSIGNTLTPLTSCSRESFCNGGTTVVTTNTFSATGNSNSFSGDEQQSSSGVFLCNHDIPFAASMVNPGSISMADSNTDHQQPCCNSGEAEPDGPFLRNHHYQRRSLTGVFNGLPSEQVFDIKRRIETLPDKKSPIQLCLLNAAQTALHHKIDGCRAYDINPEPGHSAAVAQLTLPTASPRREGVSVENPTPQRNSGYGSIVECSSSLDLKLHHQESLVPMDCYSQPFLQASNTILSKCSPDNSSVLPDVDPKVKARSVCSSHSDARNPSVPRRKQSTSSLLFSRDGGSSGSGSDGGYAGSASSNDNCGTGQSSASSPSDASSEEEPNTMKSSKAALRVAPSNRNYSSHKSSGFSSSEIADFSSGEVTGSGNALSFVLNSWSRSSSRLSSDSLSSSGDGFSDEVDGRSKDGTKVPRMSSTRSNTALSASVSKSASATDLLPKQPGLKALSTNKRRRLQGQSDSDNPVSMKKSVWKFSHQSNELVGTKTTGLTSADIPKNSLLARCCATSCGKTIIERFSKSDLRNEIQFDSQPHSMSNLFETVHDEGVRNDNSLANLGQSMVVDVRAKGAKPMNCNERTAANGEASLYEKAPIYNLGVDVMANVMSFLEPTEVYSVLTVPLSKTWRFNFILPQDLWKVICLSEPFHAKLENRASWDDGSDESGGSFPMCNNLDIKHLFGRYRLLYTSFVRCIRYLARIKDDAVNGRAPSSIDDFAGSKHLLLNDNASLKEFFARARDFASTNNRCGARHHFEELNGSSSNPSNSKLSPHSVLNSARMNLDPQPPVRLCDNISSVGHVNKDQKTTKEEHEKPKVKFGHSKLTQKLLGPSKSPGIAGPVDLPWSCAIYSIVNWMVAFTDVEGIQTMCLNVLPFLLEDENQRTTARHAGLTDIVLRGMVLFPDSVKLHTASFHTLVLLARPLGGKEGMLFHSAMVDASNMFNKSSNTGKNGIAVMLDSMRRFAHDDVLQAMSCWSMVNIALIPSQKTMLVRLGGISSAANAMRMHPHNSDVQFRALFALINLVIPSENFGEGVAEAIQDQLGDAGSKSEQGMLDENIGEIANLVVVAMKNFCSSEAILNRACLVLHNLSLNEEYHTTLLWTPNCYQMLEWCIGNYRHDKVLQQSAGGTLQRLQTTLANDSDLRMRFAQAIREQQQSLLEQARREALYLHDQQQRSEQNPQQIQH